MINLRFERNKIPASVRASIPVCDNWHHSETKHINLSLHYVEQVIVSLGQEGAGHIPDGF